MSIDTGDSVTLEYTGRLDDETVFDTSRKSVAEETGLAEVQPDREYAPLTVEVGTAFPPDRAGVWGVAASTVGGSIGGAT